MTRYSEAVSLSVRSSNVSCVWWRGALVACSREREPELPLGFYSKKRRVLSELERGSRVAVPREQIAQGRALWVLDQYGLVGFDELLGPAARLSDVQHNPRRLELVTAPQRDLHERLETDELVALSFADAARLGLAPARDALAMEDGFSPCAQILSVRRG